MDTLEGVPCRCVGRSNIRFGVFAVGVEGTSFSQELFCGPGEMGGREEREHAGGPNRPNFKHGGRALTGFLYGQDDLHIAPFH